MKTIAIITGASSGLGREFVKQINVDHVEEIWAIALNKKNLETLAKEVITPIKQFDLDLAKQESFDVIKKALQKEKPNVKWVINAAGFAKFGSFEEIDSEVQAQMIDVNCKATVNINNLAIPYMKEYSKIINLASVASFVPLPYINIYSAAKSFVLNYSRALSQELKRKHIYVTCVCPFWTKTKFFDKAECSSSPVVSYYACMYDPTLVVKQALKDAIKHRKTSIYGKKTKWIRFLAKILPANFMMWVWQKQQKLFDKYRTLKK